MQTPVDAREIFSFHRFLLSNTTTRLAEYRRAIAQMVKPGDIVLDLGTGTGILAFFACLAGAARVYAIEMDSVVELARLLARGNGFDDRIIFLDRRSDDLTLPERVDVIVTDTFGSCGLQRGGLRSLIDARDRFLKPGGTVMPATIEVVATPTETPDIYNEHIEVWSRNPHGLDFSPARQFATNNPSLVRLEEQTFLAEPASIAGLDLYHLDQDVFHGTAGFAARRRGVVHGFCAWFTATLCDTIVISNRPTTTTTNYVQTWLPLSQPLTVEAGDRIELALSSCDNYHYRWQAEVGAPDAASASRIRFDQSTFWGFPMSGSNFRKVRPDYTPELSRRGQAERSILEWFDGKTSVAEATRRLQQHSPDLFGSEEALSGFVAEVVRRCT